MVSAGLPGTENVEQNTGKNKNNMTHPDKPCDKTHKGTEATVSER